jgi:phosphoglycolate phosphatase
MPLVPLIVFDLDGTIVDSRRDLAESANEMLETYGAGPLAVDAVAAMVGEGARVLVERALRAAGLDPAVPAALDRFLAIYDRRLLVHTRPYDGLSETIHETARVATVAVLTNKPEAPARRLLDAFDLTRSVRWVVGGDSGWARKPDPAGLLDLIARAATTPERTMMVGDSPIDADTARRAGATFCAAIYGFGRATNGDYTARSASDLAMAIRTFTMTASQG